MDAHYQKVMSARDKITDTGQRLYFAYSGILDREAFEQWKVEHSYQFFNLPEGQVAEAKDFDLIFDFPSRWWGGRVAGLVAKPSSSVFGRLFSINAKDWPVVQHKEGFVTGMSVECEIAVTTSDGIKKATAFVTNPARKSLEGPVSLEYLTALIRGAKSSGLPEHYIDSIRGRGV